MSFPRYPAYKDSGVEWLGEIPAHWEIFQARRAFGQRSESARFDDDQLSATQKYGVIPQRIFMELEDQKVVLAIAGTDNFNHVEKNDFVISLRSFQGGIEISKYNGCVSPAYTVLKNKLHGDPIYWAFLLKSKGFISAINSVVEGIRDGKNISYEQFGNLKLPIPPVCDQSAVAIFLLMETAKIDALIAEQEHLIVLLKEKRQAVISHAVTKGLNPDVPMKDSGSRWLGKIPITWDVLPLKHACLHVVDCLHTTPHYEGDVKYPAIRTSDIDRGVIFIEQARLVNEDVYLERIQRLKPETGDILYSREGERFGMAALVPNGVTLCLGQRMMMFRVNGNFHPDYVMWVLNSSSIYDQVLEKVTGSTSPHVNISDIINFRIAKPKLPEQEEIAQFIRSNVHEIDGLIKEAGHAIALLQERRSALISAAVTGKIDVRGLASAPGEAA